MALRVGMDLKIVLRSGSAWATGTYIQSNDGWFGGAQLRTAVMTVACM